VSSAHDDEPGALEQNLPAELAGELLPGEDALVDGPPRAVREAPLFPALEGIAFARHGCDHHELRRDSPRLGEEAAALWLLEMAVEIAREDALERMVLERERKRVSLNEVRVRRLLSCDLEHPRACIQSDYLSAQVRGQKPGAAGGVECMRGRETRDECDQRSALFVPARPIAIRVEPCAEPPVVVLRRAVVVVRLHRCKSSAMKLPLESVPNFSEGRDAETISALGGALGARADVLDVHSDVDHNRSVFTLVGDDVALVEGLLAGIACARERIDLRKHEGAHPRIGAADVVPIVALDDADRERARDAALRLAQRIGLELELPVFLYGESAPGRGPAFFRRGGPGELQRRIDAGELEPDFGPSQLDERAGGVIVGARRPLIALNVNLATADVEVARAIASVVREKGGGFAGVRALGLSLPSAGHAQVSMNVEDFEAAALHEIVARVDEEARDRGTVVMGAELVGLMPAGAAVAAAGAILRIDGFDPSHVLELRLLERLGAEG